jgi:CIC family chloride channel protein
VGREGPIVQIGSALGSVTGQLAGVSGRRLQLLVACGAAGGISATFNAPIAGVFFALEVILRDFETQAFGVVVISSVAAAALARSIFGSASFLHLPAFQLASPAELLLYAALGALAGVAGILFIRVLYGAEDLADRLWRGPAWARPAVGGVLLGLLLLALPQMYGVGYPVLARAVEGHYAIAFLVVLLVGKIVATSLTISIGGSGGVFAPSLFMGAMLGAGFGQLAHGALPDLTAPAGAYALVGMGAVFAGAARAPITAVVIVFELTGDYSIILPLMFAIVLATAISERISDDTIYTLKLRRRGIRVDRPRVVSVMQTVSAGEAMAALPATLDHRAPMSAAVERIVDGDETAIPVLDEHGRLLGLISASDLEDDALSHDDAASNVGALAHTASTVHVGESLEEAVRALSRTDDPAVVVVDDVGEHPVGWITHRAALRTYHRGRERLTPRDPQEEVRLAATAGGTRAATGPAPDPTVPSPPHDPRIPEDVPAG